MEIVKLTEPQRRLVALIPAGLIFIWIGYLLAVKPVLVRVNNMKMSISTADERLGLIMDIQNYKKRQMQVEELLATEQTRHDLLNKLTAYANETGVTINSLTPQFEQMQPYNRLAFEAKAQAKFPSLIRFLTKLENSKPGVAVHKMNVSSARGYQGYASSETPQIDFTLEAYLK